MVNITKKNRAKFQREVKPGDRVTFSYLNHPDPYTETVTFKGEPRPIYGSVLMTHTRKVINVNDVTHWEMGE